MCYDKNCELVSKTCPTPKHQIKSVRSTHPCNFSVNIQTLHLLTTQQLELEPFSPRRLDPNPPGISGDAAPLAVEYPPEVTMPHAARISTSSLPTSSTEQTWLSQSCRDERRFGTGLLQDYTNYIILNIETI